MVPEVESVEELLGLEPDEPPVVLLPLLLPPVEVPLPAKPPDDGLVLLLPVPAPDPLGIVLLEPDTGPAAGTVAVDGWVEPGPVAGTVATDGCVVTGVGWVVTGVG